MYSIYFIVKALTMEHRNLWAVSKLRFYKSFHYSFFLSRFTKGARRARALSFWHAFFQRLLTCSLSFQSPTIVILRSIPFVFDSVEEPSMSVVDGSLQLNPLNSNPTKWSNTLKQFVGKLPTNCLSVFDHFAILALKDLKELDSCLC